MIGSFQAVKHMCAEMAAELEPCRSLVWYAAHAFTSIPEEGRLMASHAKAHLAEVGKFVARKSTEVHGGMGITDLLGMHYWFKRIGFNRQLLGTGVGSARGCPGSGVGLRGGDPHAPRIKALRPSDQPADKVARSTVNAC